MSQREERGQTCILVAVNGRVAAAMAIADPLKTEAVGVVAALQQEVSRAAGRAAARGRGACVCGGGGGRDCTSAAQIAHLPA